jgi:probable phosphoglycerate mutase
MSDTTTIIFVRHVETEWNRDHRLQGQTDSPLTDTGMRQGERLAARMRGTAFTALYASDIGRAWATARWVADATGREIVVDTRLRERHFGVLEGLTGPEMIERHPEVHARFKSLDPDYVVPEGESARQTYTRVVECFEEIVARHHGETVVAVSHGLVLDALYRHTVGQPLHVPRTLKLVNASLNFFHREPKAWRLGELGDVAHLAEDATVFGGP